MWNPFRKTPVLSDEDQYFQIECYKWLLMYFGGVHFYEETQLVLPIEEFFPSQIDSAGTAAQSTFEQVKKYAGMEEWACILEVQDEDPNLVVAPTIVVQNVDQNPLGTFSVDESQEVTISYNPNIVSNPIQMVATFAHELSHYLTETAVEPPPGGWENGEFATDICATFLGFGIFQANSAFSFRQYTDVDSQGWQASRSGYLSEAEHSYALAIFLLLKRISPKLAYPYCDPNIKSYLSKAIKELENSNFIEELRMVKYNLNP